jgi:hypothetical protein
MPSGNGYSYNSSGTNSQVHLSLFLKAHYKENQNIHGNSLLFEHCTSIQWQCMLIKPALG